MDFDRRHIEHFGPDLGRGPVLSGQPEVAAVQIAAALAQLRTPLLRSDSELTSHAEFIRALADALFPDYAAAIRFTVGTESGDVIPVNLHVGGPGPSLIHCWLADSSGGGVTGTAPDSVTWTAGTVVHTLTALKSYLVLVPSSGVAAVQVGYAGEGSWYLGATRQGRIYFSSELDFVG